MNVFDMSLIRPKHLNGSTSIKVTPKPKIILDGCEKLAHMEIEPGKVAKQVQILGPFPEHLYIEGRFNDLRLGGSMQLIDWGGFVGEWRDGCICDHLQPMLERPDIMLMVFPRSANDVLVLGPEYCGKSLAIRGPSTIKRIVIEPEVQMEHIRIQSMPWLEKIELKGRVTQLEISNTPRLDSVSGHGLALSCKTNGHHKEALTVRGFWLNLDVTSRECDMPSFVLPEVDLREGLDLQGRLIYSNDYPIACGWAEVFDIDVDQAVLGITFQQLMELWLENETKAYCVFEEWLGDDRHILDRKYYGMRIAMFLFLNGHKDSGLRARNNALSGKAIDTLQPFNHQPVVHWMHREMEIFAPYDILDLEFLARAAMDNEMPTLDGRLSDAMHGRNNLLHWLAIFQKKREDDFSEVILGMCEEHVQMLSKGLGPNQEFQLYESISLIIHSLEMMEDCPRKNALVLPVADAVMEIQHSSESKACLIIALMQVEDKPSLRKYLSRLMFNLDRSVVKVVNAFRMAGVNAFKRVWPGPQRFEFPYQNSWRRLVR